jgi:peptide/nickel transport system permease protein
MTTLNPSRPTLLSGRRMRRARGPSAASTLSLLLTTLGRLVLVIFGVLTVLFLLLQSAGDPASAIAGQESTAAEVQRIREEMGFDRPMVEQYVDFVRNAVTFDFGDSYQTPGLSAMGLLMERLPSTLGLIGAAYAVALLGGLLLGMASGLSRSRFLHWFTNGFVVAGQAVPAFAIAVALVWLFAAQLQLVPALASDGFGSPIQALVLPICVLALHPAAQITEIVRSGLHESLQEDFVRTAESKGAAPWRVVSRHALRPVLTSLVTVIGLDLASMLSGGVIVEVIFAWPGLGPSLVSSVSNRDYPVLQAATFTVAVLVVLINFVTELAYRRLDPRIRKEGA